MPRSFLKLAICQICNLPVPECDALAVARGVALRYLREFEGYSDAHAQAAVERLMPGNWHEPISADDHPRHFS